VLNLTHSEQGPPLSRELGDEHYDAR